MDSVESYPKPKKIYNYKGVWYMTYTDECVLCGRGSTWRERRTPPAPPKEKRYKYNQYVCGYHFC